MKPHSDDPRLTAYVLDELDPAERDAVAEGIQESMPLYTEAMEVYETASWLKDELKRAPVAGLDAEREAAVEEAIERRETATLADLGPTGDDITPANLVEFPGVFWRWAVGGAALAACVALAFVGWQRWKPLETRVARMQLAPLRGNPGPMASTAPSEGGTETQPVPATVPPPEPPSGALAPTTSDRQPMTDIRMMMRYGLMPKGMKVEVDSIQPAPLATPRVQPAPEMPPADSYRARHKEGKRASGAPPSAPSSPGSESYARIVENPFLDPLSEPLSTFGVDVDTASYSLVRRFLNEGRRPPRDAVRIEEMINYFNYDYAPPRSGEPFAVHLEVAGCPWNAGHRLVRVGLKARDLAPAQRPPCNLVFLVDVSGSMEPANKLPLLRQGLRMLVERLRPQDTVAIVVYADRSRVVLPPTPGDRPAEILAALENLRASGSTNGGAGLRTAYELAHGHFQEGGANRVILCTDGDFNVGITDPAELVRFVQGRARSGVFLSVLGFGVGNLKDATMERLADEGNGNYAYVDTLNEAHKVLVAQMSGTLVTVAKDVKAQVEFNPAFVRAYRLIGYENRLLAAEDFNDDRRDAGDVGAGHAVTVFYEVEPANRQDRRPGVDPLKYQPGAVRPRPPTPSGEWLTLKLRYQEPEGGASRVIEVPVVDAGAGYAEASPDFRFAAAVASFGMILRDSPHRGNATVAGVIELAGGALGDDREGHRAAFLDLVRRAGTNVAAP